MSQAKQLYILCNTVHLPMSTQTMYVTALGISECKVKTLIETSHSLLCSLSSKLMINSKEPVYFFNFLKALQKLSFMFYRCPKQ